MPPAGVIFIAAAAAALWWGGATIGHGVKKAAVATNHHVLRPVGCGVEKGITFGHKHCAPKSLKK